MRYLDSKNDLNLNAHLPVETPIQTIEYLPAERVPEIPIFKNSIVDVRRQDEKGKMEEKLESPKD